MKTYPDLTELHQIICNRFCNSCKDNHPSSPELTDEEKEMLNDLEHLDRIAEKYLGARMKDYIFVSD